MKTSALRVWGIAVSGALMAAAVAIAAQPESTPTNVGMFETVQSQTEAQPLSFIVRFRGTGPIARSQAQAARGDTQAAQRQVEVQLVRQTDFAGLCFDRFTVGGAEIVLRTCDAIAASERDALQQRWLTRLRAMRSVAYADANTNASRTAPG